MLILRLKGLSVPHALFLRSFGWYVLDPDQGNETDVVDGMPG